MSAGSTIGSLVNLVVVGAVWCVLGVVVVKLNTYANGMGLAQDAMNTIYYLEIGFWISGFLYLMAVILNHWINSKNEASMGV